MKGWKTVIFGALLAAAGFLQTVDWAQVMPSDPKMAGMVVAAIGGVVMLLRLFTNSPVGQK